MKKTIILLILFIALGGGTFYMLKNQDSLSTTADQTDADFAVKNIDEVYKIFIADRQDYRVLLERKNGYWLYNKKYKAKSSAISQLLGTISNLEMKYTTPRGAEKPMIRNIATTGVKVEIYDKNDHPLKVYYVGGSTANTTGTIMMMEGAKEPYVVQVPSFNGLLRGIYLKRPDDWRDSRLFGETVEEIKSVSVDYPKQRSKSFTITRADNGFEVKPFYKATPVKNKPLLKGAVEKYLTGFSVLHAEAFVNNNPERDSIIHSLPFVNLTLVNMKGDTTKANLFPIIHKDQYGNPVSFANGNMKSSQAIGRYFLNYSDGSFRLVQHRVFERIFWSYDSFF